MGLEPNKEDQRMARKRLKPEDIVAKLRQVEVLQSQGMVVAESAERQAAGKPSGEFGHKNKRDDAQEKHEEERQSGGRG